MEDEIYYYEFTTDDKNLSKFIEEHPEILSSENIIRDNDPRFGD